MKAGQRDEDPQSSECSWSRNAQKRHLFSAAVGPGMSVLSITDSGTELLITQAPDRVCRRLTATRQISLFSSIYILRFTVLYFSISRPFILSRPLMARLSLLMLILLMIIEACQPVMSAPIYDSLRELITL
jgi:hypothetical protein